MIPIFIIEEHHEAFYTWCRAMKEGVIAKEDNCLLHFDDHSDLRSPLLKTSINDLLSSKNDEELKRFVFEELNIDTFISPLVYLGIINEMIWVKNDMTKESRNPLYFRSYNGEGRNIIMTKELQKNEIKDIKKLIFQRLDFENFNIIEAWKDKKVILDIDLDFFSCIEKPQIENEIIIEVTKREFKEFNNNNYHPLKFITSNIYTKELDGQYYYVINHYPKVYPSGRLVDEEVVLERIEKLTEYLHKNKIIPQIITICRSRHSGFTPEKQWRFIESHLTSALKSIYKQSIYECI